MLKKNMGQNYNPLYFLAALGNGGLSVAFFIYPMFMLNHSGYPMPTFEHIARVISKGNQPASALMVLALASIVYFAFSHYRLLFWNIREYRIFKQTGAFNKLKSSNAEVTLMAIPLTLAMSINVMFILGIVFVPGLWNYVEYLFPFALLGFIAVGGYALKIFTGYYTRIICSCEFDFSKNNNLSQLISIFAFAMISVGLAAPAAMSHNLAVSATAMFAAIFFGSVTVMLAFIKLIIGFKSILKQGIDQESSPTLWVMIPIITVLGIALVRITMGVYHNLLHQNPSPAAMFILLSALISVQIFFGLLGYYVLKQNKYFADYIHGNKKHAGSYTLICPGVASFVFGMFFIYYGLVENHMINMFSPLYFVVLLPLVLIKLKTILILFKLNRKLLYQYNAHDSLALASKNIVVK